MIKAVIFDCFGVLTVDRWQDFVEDLKPSIDIEAARRLHRLYDAGQISKKECQEGIIKFTGETFTEIEDINGGFVKNNKLLDYIKKLSETYVVAIASNIGSDWIRQNFLSEAEQTLFSHMFLSYELGMVKPDPRFFEKIIKTLNVMPSEIIFVDDKQSYCEQAKKLGFKTVAYVELQQCVNDITKLIKNEHC